MIRMSVIRGTLEITDSPVASSAAAINLSAEFFAPPTATSPASRAPPTTRITSTPVIVEVSDEVRTLSTMAVHLTRIYTRTGDAGTTGLGDGSRVRKTDPRIAAYADTDECNAAIGVALALGQLPEEIRAVLTVVQNDLFDVGADFATPIAAAPKHPPLRVTEDYVTRVEGWCDEFNGRLSTLDSFILPGGTPGAALLHAARTVARRAERSAWALYEVDAQRTNPVALTYLNRLSDLLFILSRVANPDGDVLWKPGGDR
jgi:cob(I)alamin adenosyltransferase